MAQPKYHYRSNLSSPCKLITELELDDSQKKCLKKYCSFWRLIKAIIEGNITAKTCKKNYLEVESLISHYDQAEEEFVFKNTNKSLKLTKQDVIECFGIDGGETVYKRNSKKCEKSELFKKKIAKLQVKKVSMTSMADALRVAATHRGSEEENNLMCQVMTLYLLANVFVSSQDGALNWTYNKYMLDVSKIKEIDWAQHILDELNKSLKYFECAKKVKGCVILLPYWFMEKFRGTEPMKEDAELWVEKWNLDNFSEVLNKYTKPKKVILTNTQSTNIVKKHEAPDEPIEDEPVEDEPSDYEPSEDEPVEDEPSEYEPIEDEPVEDEPSEYEPIEDEPSEDEPKDTQDVEPATTLEQSQGGESSVPITAPEGMEQGNGDDTYLWDSPMKEVIDYLDLQLSEGKKKKKSKYLVYGTACQSPSTRRQTPSRSTVSKRKRAELDDEKEESFKRWRTKTDAKIVVLEQAVAEMIDKLAAQIAENQARQSQLKKQEEREANVVRLKKQLQEKDQEIKELRDRLSLQESELHALTEAGKRKR